MDKTSNDLIQAADLNTLLSDRQKGVQVVDVRDADEYAYEHIDGARWLSLRELAAKYRECDPARPVVTVCQSGVRSLRGAEILRTHGFGNVRSLEGGVNAWKKAGLPLIRTSRVWGIERQVRLAAGMLILTGVLLGHFVDGRWFWLSGFVGAGLVFAAVTNTCGMALLLQKMPWNRK